MMNSIIHAARVLFVFIAAFLVAASGYVLWNLASISGSNGLAILGAAIASIGVIASWNRHE